MTTPSPVGTVTIELLNQLEDKSHHKKSVTFQAGRDCSQRVLDEEVGFGWGKAKFISRASLNYQQDKNCQYLKDETLLFRISVQLSNNTLYVPWMECTIIDNHGSARCFNVHRQLPVQRQTVIS